MTSNERRRSTLRGIGPTRRDTLDGTVEGLSERKLRILEAVYHEAALTASEDSSPGTLQELEDELAVAAHLERLLRGR
jgi:hypothetical protein